MSKSITRLQYDTGNEGASYLYETQLSEKAHGGVSRHDILQRGDSGSKTQKERIIVKQNSRHESISFSSKKMKKRIKKIGDGILDKGVATWGILILLWFIASLFYDETFLPSPLETIRGTKEIVLNGQLLKFSLISLRRVFIGWSIGTLVAAPLGLLVGRISVLRRLVEPFVNFFRFIPGLALLTLFLMWFGVGETSKVVLILYGTIFTVMVNTIAGVMAVDQNRINSARTLGASEWQIISTVIWPSIIPYVFTGARLGLGGAFSSIIAAEMLAAKEGLGYMIYTARMYFHTDWIFTGVIALGLLGFLSDKLLRVWGNHFLAKYGVNEKGAL